MRAKRNPGASIPGAPIHHHSNNSAHDSTVSTPQGALHGFGDAAIDLTACTFGELAYFCAGILHGAHQQAQRDDERESSRFAALHGRAAAVVHSMAEVPERDAEADAERASKRAAWWAARRQGRPE